MELKDSGFSWIRKIPVNWEVRRVKQVFYQKKEKAFIDNPTILSLARDGVKIRDISTNEGQLAADYSTYNPVSKNDLLLNPMDLYSGDNCNISRVTGVISPAYVNLRNICQFDTPEFFNYYFKYQYWSMAFFAHGRGVSFDNRWTLTNEVLRNYPVLYPPVQEQKAIANYLDKECARIDDIVEKQRNIIEKLKEYKKSVITEAVTKGLNPNVKMKDSGIEWIGDIPEHWEIRRIKTLGEYRNGLTYNPENMVAPEEGTLVLRSSNVQNGQLVFEDNVFVNCAIPEQLFVHKEDIIICSRNGSRELIGKNAIVKENIRASFGAFMMVLRSKYSEYISYVLNSAIFNYYLGSFFTSTINQLTGGNFGNMRIVFCPDEKERAEIIRYLDKKVVEIDSVIEKREKMIDLLTEYKKSLIYECVTGKKEVA